MRKTTFQWSKVVSEAIFPLIRGRFLLKSGLRFSFWAPEVPERRVRKRPLSLSLRNTKGGKSGFRPHGAIIHWSGIFEPSERSLGVLGRITQDNVFKAPETNLNSWNITKL